MTFDPYILAFCDKQHDNIHHIGIRTERSMSVFIRVVLMNAIMVGLSTLLHLKHNYSLSSLSITALESK